MTTTGGRRTPFASRAELKVMAAIAKKDIAISGSHVASATKCSSATVYMVLRRLQDKEMVAAKGGGKPHLYKLLPKGRRLLAFALREGYA
jgi:predicted transcriptional regulator